MLLVGIGEIFIRNKRKWVVVNIKEGNYICETIDNKEKEKITKNFTRGDMYKIFGGV